MAVLNDYCKEADNAFINNIRHRKPLPIYGKGENVRDWLFVENHARAIDPAKLQHELGWEPSLQFEGGIERTVRRYLDNQAWMDNITSGNHKRYCEEMHKGDLSIHFMIA